MSGLKKLGEEYLPEKTYDGLEDGGEILVDCSNCNALLMQVVLTHPGEEKVTKLRANCPFCGDRSFIVEIKGSFHPGGVVAAKPDDPTDYIPSTKLKDCVTFGDVVTFILEKGSPNAKPVRKS